MLKSEQDGTDDTPIQPVSSLRSHFEHMIDQPDFRSPTANINQRTKVSAHVLGRFDDQSHNQTLIGSPLNISTSQSASYSHSSKFLVGGTTSLGGNGKSRSDDLKSHHSSSDAQERPLSEGLSYSVPSLPAIKGEACGSPMVPPFVAKRKPAQQRSTQADTPGPPSSHPQPRPLNSFRSVSSHQVRESSFSPQIGIESEKLKVLERPAPSSSRSKFEPSPENHPGDLLGSTGLPTSDVNSNEKVARPQIGNVKLLAQIAAEKDRGSHVINQLQGQLPINGANSERRKAGAGHQAFELRLPPSLAAEQKFRPQLPPRQRVENRSRQLVPASKHPSFDRTHFDHYDEPQKSLTKLRVLSAPQPSWSKSPSARVESDAHLARSNFFSQPTDRTNSLSQTQGSPITGDLTETMEVNTTEPDTSFITNQNEYPDSSCSNRRHPVISHGAQLIQTNYDTKLLETSNRYLCTTGYLTKAWDLMSGEMIMNLSLGEKELRVTALAFKPTGKEDVQVWLGTNYGDLYEVDISSQAILYSKPAAHNRREIVKIYRFQKNMWTLDDDGKLNIWRGSEYEMPSLHQSPLVRRLPRGHIFSILVQDTLWFANSTGVRIFRPDSDDDARFVVRDKPLSQPGVGEITSGAIIPGKPGVVYFGHTDGKVTSYSTGNLTCLGVFNISIYKINCLVGAGSYLWAGYSNGMIYVYETDTTPWKIKKVWQAHDRPVISMSDDFCTMWNPAQIRVASIGTDNTVRLWDGMLEQDWLEHEMHDHENDYCTSRKISAAVVTWNAGASTPSSLRHDTNNSKIFTDLLHIEAPSDLLVFGFQELVDLEDKKVTAKNIFKGNKKKDSADPDHMSRQHRAWRDYLIRCIEDNMPSVESYQLLHTASMVGLFSCVFVKASQRNCIKNISAAELKRGLGGLHGNKGALILRFTFDDSSLCFVNCHLAAGQSQTNHRNNDASAILEATILPSELNLSICCDRYVGGGDGSMVLDHEICVLNGDLNYRIETMGRETVIKAIQTQQYHRLLERDQLLVSRRRNPGFRLRDFQEFPIVFAPTYKYDPGTDNYDTSEKHRTPAWCDRILCRGSGKVEQIKYQRHELQISDHRPVSGVFVMTIKKIVPSKRMEAWTACNDRFVAYRRRMIDDYRSTG